MCRLSRVEQDYPEESIPSPPHRRIIRQDQPRQVLLKVRRTGRLPSTADGGGRRMEDSIQVSLWAVRIQRDAVRAVQRPRDLPTLYERYIPRLPRQISHYISGRLAHLLRYAGGTSKARPDGSRTGTRRGAVSQTEQVPVPRARGNILGIRNRPEWDPDGPNEGRGCHLVASSQVGNRGPDVPGPSELLLTFHSELQQDGRPHNGTAEEGSPVQMDSGSSSYIRGAETGVHDGPDPPPLRPIFANGSRSRCIRFCRRGGGLATQPRNGTTPPYHVLEPKVQFGRA